MKTAEILKRIDAILECLPKDEIAIEVEKRYAGSDKLASIFGEGLAQLKQLRADLAQEK
jgi:hypothetical protein